MLGVQVSHLVPLLCGQIFFHHLVVILERLVYLPSVFRSDNLRIFLLKLSLVLSDDIRVLFWQVLEIALLVAGFNP